MSGARKPVIDDRRESGVAACHPAAISVQHMNEALECST